MSSFSDALQKTRERVHNNLKEEGKAYNEKYTQSSSSSGSGSSTPSTPSSPRSPQTSPFDTQAYAKQYQDQINNMYDQQRQAQLEQIRAQRDQAVGQINQQKTQVAPQYQGMRNQADVGNAQKVKQLRELMAANGLNASGENVTASTSLANERQNSINSLNLQEQQTMDDFNRRITDLRNPANENALIAQLEAERSRALLDMGMQADQIGYSRGRDSIMDSRYVDELGYSRGRDSIMDNRYTDELGYSRGRDSVEDQRFDQQWDYQVGRDEVADQRYEDETKWNQQRQKMEYAWRKHTYNNMSATEKAQLDNLKYEFGEEMGWRLHQMEYDGTLDQSMNQALIDFYKKSGFNNAEEGGGYTNNYKTQQQSSKSSTYKDYQGHLQSAIKMGVPSGWASALTELVGRESSWNSTAKNPNSTAHGYGQFLNSTRANYEKKTGLDYSNPIHQLVMMSEYVKDRYGTPEKALAFWDKNKWY